MKTELNAGTDNSSGAEKEPTKGSLLVIFLTVFIDLLGFGMVLPLLPIYADQFVVDPNGWQLGMLMAIFSIMQLFFAPVWGSLSDRIGRRPVLMLGLASSMTFYLLFAVATVYESFWFLFITRLGAGIAGATIPTAQAYIADTTGVKKRAKGMALIGLAFGMGFTFGPLLGLLAVPSEKGVPGPWPGYFAAGLSLVALLLAIFKLPESRTPASKSAKRAIIDWKGLAVASRIPSIPSILLVIFICVFSFANFETTLSMLMKGSRDVPNPPFEFTWSQICLTYAFIGFTLAIVQGGIVRPLSSRIPEKIFAPLGIVIEVAGFFFVAWAIQQSQVFYLYAALVVIVTGYSCMQPSLNSLLSRRADPEKQGVVLGLGQSVNALARIFGSGLGIPLLKIHPMAPYFLAAGIMGLSLFFLIPALNKGKDYEPAEGPVGH